MQQALRPYATAGVALVGAGLIAITPMAPRLPDTVTVQDIKLTSGDDLLTPWTDVYNTAAENATQLINNEALAPAVGLQQFIVNESDFLQDFFNDPTSSTVASISQEMQENLTRVLMGYTLQGPVGNFEDTGGVLATVIQHTLDGESADSSYAFNGHTFLFNELPSFLPPSVNAAEVVPIVNFLASPASGEIMGDLGPFIAPLVALDNSITAGDDLNTTLADMVGAFFNGADLNLDSLIPLIAQSGYLPFSVTNLDIAFGGLLSPGTVFVGPYNDSIPAVGGSIFNSLGITAAGVPSIGGFELTGQAIGPLGAWEGWDQTIGALLGSGWSDGALPGPVDVTAPLTGLDLPTIPADFLDGSTIPAATADLSSLVQDLVSALGI